MSLWDGAVMTIFAREVLEGLVIIGQYRTVVQRSEEWNNPPERQKEGLKAINVAAGLATLAAVILIICVAVPLGVLSKEFDEKVGDVIEGVSKVVAAICILQLSLKIPKFLGVYASKKGEDGRTIGLSIKSIRFNVAWNVWREVAEIGVFLIPFFLGGAKAKAIPLSGLAGIAVGAVLAAIIYWGNHKLKNKFWLSSFMATLLLFLSVGLFVGGCHEFEEVWGMTPNVYNYRDYGNGHLNEKEMPMALLKPFGYSAKRSQLQIACFWSWLVFGCLLHLYKYITSKKIREAQDMAEQELADAAAAKNLDMQETEPMDESSQGKDSEGTDEAQSTEEAAANEEAQSAEEGTAGVAVQ